MVLSSVYGGKDGEHDGVGFVELSYIPATKIEFFGATVYHFTEYIEHLQLVTI